MDEATRIAILGAPLDLGASRRGVDMGPSAIRYSGLAERLEGIGLEVDDFGNVAAELPEVAAEADERARYLPAILVSCAQIAARVAAIAGEGRMPLVLGGDHSIAMGTLAGLRAAHGTGGLLWIDAHGDLNRLSCRDEASCEKSSLLIFAPGERAACDAGWLEKRGRIPDMFMIMSLPESLRRSLTLN